MQETQGQAASAPHEPRQPAQQRPAQPPSPRASRQGRTDRLAAGKPPWAWMTVTSVRAPSAPLYRQSLKRPRSDLAAAGPSGSLSVPSPPCGSPRTGHSAVGPPRPQPPPEPPTMPTTPLNPKAHPLLASPAPLPCSGALGPGPLALHPLPRCPFLAFLASPTTTNSLQEGPRPGLTVWEGDLGTVRFHRWCLPSGRGQIASTSCKPRAALDGRWGAGLLITIQPDG